MRSERSIPLFTNSFSRRTSSGNHSIDGGSQDSRCCRIKGKFKKINKFKILHQIRLPWSSRQVQTIFPQPLESRSSKIYFLFVVFNDSCIKLSFPKITLPKSDNPKSTKRTAIETNSAASLGWSHCQFYSSKNQSLPTHAIPTRTFNLSCHYQLLTHPILELDLIKLNISLLQISINIFDWLKLYNGL